MLIMIRFTPLLFLTFLFSPTGEEGYLDLYITDVTSKSIPNVMITCQEGCSTTMSDSRGKARLKLPPQIRSDDWVTLQIVNRSGGQQWVLISPWDYRLNLPSFANKPNNTSFITIARKGDRQILSSGKAVEIITARILYRLRTTLEKEISDEARRLVLKEQAEAVGLTPSDVDNAIREWGKSAHDPFQQGLAALYEKNFPKAEELLTMSYKISKEEKEKTDAKFADRAFFLGLAKYEQGKFSEAAEKFQEADAIRKGDAETLDSLGASLLKAGRYSEAQAVLEHALGITEKKLGRDHLDTARILNTLAALYDVQGRYAEAEPLYKRALDIIGRTFGDRPYSIAATLNNLAKLYQSHRRYAEAEPLYKRALDIMEKALTKDDPYIPSILSNLASLYDVQGQYSEAEPLYKRALDINERILSKDHPDTAVILNNLGHLYQSRGRYAEAEPLLKRALEIREKVLDKDHPDTAITLNNLALLYHSQNRYDAAEPLYRRALDIMEKALGKDHPYTAGVLNNLGGVYYSQKKYDEAEPLFKRALDIREKVLGKDHPDTAMTISHLAVLYARQGRYAEAEPLLERTLDINERVLSQAHPQIIRALTNLGGFYYSQKKYAEAEPYYKRLLELAERALNKNPPGATAQLNSLSLNYAALLQSLALTYFYQDKHAEAEPLYKQALDIRERILGKEHEDVATILVNYAALLRKTNRDEEAVKMETRAKEIREKAKLK